MNVSASAAYSATRQRTIPSRTVARHGGGGRGIRQILLVNRRVNNREAGVRQEAKGAKGAKFRPKRRPLFSFSFALHRFSISFFLQAFSTLMRPVSRRRRLEVLRRRP